MISFYYMKCHDVEYTELCFNNKHLDELKVKLG